MATLAICLFGQPRLTFEGATFKFAAPPKALPLLAYLMLHRAAPVSREKLAFTLWEDETEEDARANLRRHLHHVQRALPACAPDTPWMLVDADTVRWNPEADAWIDVAEFEQLSSGSRDRVAAIDLYTGDLLETLYDEWLFAPRDRLRNVYQSLLGDLLLESRSVRDFSRAGTYAQRILANDPWREDAVRQLMAIRYESGDRAGALAVYQQFDKRLREEMDVDPMPETSALRDAILHNEAMSSSGPVIAAGSVDGTQTPLLPFVGRESEMEQLRALWSRAARGRGGVVLIGGEAGIGKSRLASEFALLAEAQGARVLAGATAYPESAPYQALAEAFRGAAALVASLPVEPVWLGILAQAVSELRTRISGLPTPPAADPDRERTRLFEAFSICLEALAKPRPLVVVLEDMHWAGEATVAALQFVGRRVARVAALIVATYRDEETPRSHPLRKARRELQEERMLTRVSPRPLAREAIAQLMQRTPALAVRASELAGVMLDQSAGNPLFLGEAIRNHLEGSDAALTQPLTSARLVIEMRLSRLNEASRSLAGAAAVIGQGFNIELVRDVLGWNESDVVDGLSDLLDRHIVKEAGGRSGYAYAFVHHVIQNTIYAGVPADDRRRRHRRVARVLEDAIGEQRGRFVADVARHYDLGEEPELAAPAWLEAGRYAGALYAWDEAMRHLNRCLELTHDVETRIDALLLRESIRARRGDRAGQRADLEELERFIDTTDGSEVAFSIVRRKALLARAVGERDREGALVEELLTRSDALGDDRRRAEALVASAGYATLTGDHARAHAAAEAAQALYERLGDAAGEMEARCRLVETAYHGGAFGLVGPLLAQARAAAEKTGNPALLARAINTATHVAISEQRYPECRELALEARALYRSIGDREAEADAINRQASAAARLSLLTEARQCYNEALAIYEAIGKRLGVAAVLANGGIQSVRVGQIDKAHDALKSALGHFEALKDVRGQTACNVNLSYVHLIRREADQAKVCASAALAMARSLNHAGYEAAALANLGAAERDLGDVTSALAHMRDGIAIRRKHNEPSEYADELGAVALLYARLRDFVAAQTVVDELAVALQAASPMLFMPQTAYWAAAQAFHALGDKRAAQQMVKRARDVVAEQAAAIGNAAERSAFVSLHVNQEIEAADERKKWPAP